MNKSIAHILRGYEKHITEEETVLQPLPHKDFRFANPFIVLHHLKPEYIKPGQELRIHPHPHRGFAPVTFLLQGENYHKDNAGHEGNMGEGDVQWMFAGKGLLHSEGPSARVLKEGGTQEFIQLWINVPQKNKWDEPFYQYAQKEQMPEVLKQEGVSFRLASGVVDGKTGPFKTFTPITSALGTVEKGKTTAFQAEEGYWTLLYVIDGGVTVNGTKVEAYHLVVFEKENTGITIVAEETTRLLYLSALPIDEPVSAKGNFVMNTPEEVEQAMQDYQNGLFGKLDY